MAVTITEQRYGPTTGAGTGWFSLVVCAGGAVFALVDPTNGRVRIALLLCLLGVVFWCYLLRPRVIVREQGSVLLRNAFSTWEIPLAAITDVRIKAITRVDAAGRSYDGLGVGRRVRKMVRGAAVERFGELGGPVGAGTSVPVAEDRMRDRAKPNSPEAIADLVTDQVLAAVQRAQDAGQPAGPVRRHWAWVELGLLVALAAAFAAAHL